MFSIEKLNKKHDTSSSEVSNGSKIVEKRNQAQPVNKTKHGFKRSFTGKVSFLINNNNKSNGK
jgi:hypothetical protein